ncbi:hypothetical protein F5B22DRAFT_649249 [Xylaria bambusicola]|uniref:uncharacterized protein n=1 Tax=Xylaria bambusicola TaxID=326684 RepID=UPI0020087CE8|nr:uncharacterized protein F5B22DRAFT_649249 [Xylaria bambusicola]KAI0509201.1 hypothetical protein F5B22DRAFT_649249 [Xylaria bambusicola]
MQLTSYISIIVAIAGFVSSAPSPAPANGVGTIQARKSEDGDAAAKRSAGRFKPIWVVGYDEDEEKGEHIGFRLFSEGDDDDSAAHGEGMKSHGGKTKAHAPEGKDDHESSFWYYYYTY